VSADVIHARIARIARQEFAQRYDSVEDQADAMAAAIMTGLREDGIAIVELPDSDGQDDDGQEYFGDFDIRVDHTGRGTEYPSIYIDGRPSDPEAARREAADLLAAANAAEHEPPPDPHAGELWANELQRRQRQVPADREFS
jgi:predicted nucleic acid-binding protein